VPSASLCFKMSVDRLTHDGKEVPPSGLKMGGWGC
jgi:hypothetical protein